MCVYLTVEECKISCARVVSNSWCLPLHPVNSRLRRPNPAIRGLSCILFPFFPLKPHLFAKPTSSFPSEAAEPFCALRGPISSRGVEGLEFWNPELNGLELPPNIEETDECAQRACFRIAEVTVIHSVVIRATGSTAIETIFVSENILPLSRFVATISMLWRKAEEDVDRRMEEVAEATSCIGALLLMLYVDYLGTH